MRDISPRRVKAIKRQQMFDSLSAQRAHQSEAKIIHPSKFSYNFSHYIARRVVDRHRKAGSEVFVPLVNKYFVVKQFLGSITNTKPKSSCNYTTKA
jgi:hypothetical protein